jgi:metal-sulfur cluster biosynthetic enzyme
MTSQVIREALRPVVDPEMGVSAVDLGTIRDVVTEGDEVGVTMVLTAPFCLHQAAAAAARQGRIWKHGVFPLRPAERGEKATVSRTRRKVE